MTRKDIFEKRTGLKLKEIDKKQIKKNGGHEVGKKYYCGYWQQVYEVLEIIENAPVWGWQAVCKWQDGEKNSHCTSLIPGKDFEVLEVA
jgi:hypothetical protein